MNLLAVGLVYDVILSSQGQGGLEDAVFLSIRHGGLTRAGEFSALCQSSAFLLFGKQCINFTSFFGDRGLMIGW